LANEGSGRHTHVESIARGRMLDTQNNDDMGRVGRTPARAGDCDAGLPIQDLMSRDPSPVAVRKCNQDIAALRSGNPDGDRCDKVRQRVRASVFCVWFVSSVCQSLVRSRSVGSMLPAWSGTLADMRLYCACICSMCMHRHIEWQEREVEKHREAGREILSKSERWRWMTKTRRKKQKRGERI
jgi:hypothetical protein